MDNILWAFSDSVSLIFSNPLVLVIFLFVYLIPSIVAYYRGHRNIFPILILNIFIGWTYLGWVVSLAMSATDNIDLSIKEKRQPKRKPEYKGIEEF